MRNKNRRQPKGLNKDRTKKSVSSKLKVFSSVGPTESQEHRVRSRKPCPVCQAGQRGDAERRLFPPHQPHQQEASGEHEAGKALGALQPQARLQSLGKSNTT